MPGILIRQVSEPFGKTSPGDPVTDREDAEAEKSDADADPDSDADQGEKKNRRKKQQKEQECREEDSRKGIANLFAVDDDARFHISHCSTAIIFTRPDLSKI